MAHKVIVPQKKFMSRSFLNSGTLIVNNLSLLHCAPSLYPKVELWAFTYGPLIDTVLYVNLVMKANPLLWQV
jgi:hypothetical protein